MNSRVTVCLARVKKRHKCKFVPRLLSMIVVNCYNTTLSSLLDKHAPIQSRKIRDRSRPSWFDDEIMKARRDIGKAEKWWRRTGLASDLLAFKPQRNYVTYYEQCEGIIL